MRPFFQPQKLAILSYGLQTEFLASIVLDDVIRVATLFFGAEIIRPPLEKMPETIFPASNSKVKGLVGLFSLTANF